MRNNHNTDLLGIEELKVTEVEESKDLIVINAKPKKTLQECPNCASKDLKVHDYRKQEIRDVPVRNKKTVIILDRKRHKCKSCGKNVELKFKFISKKCQMTNRLKLAIFKEFSHMKDMTLISKEYFVSTYTVKSLLNSVDVKAEELSEVLCIDEFKGDSGKEKYQTILADSKNKKVLDILPSRKLADLKEHFKKIDPGKRDKVKIFVSDMWEPFRSVKKIFFDKAIHVIDRYHYVRQVYWGLERIRKNFQKSLNKSQRRLFKNNRNLLLRNQLSLSSEERVKLAIMLERSEDLRIGYLIKESFIHHVLSQENREDARQALEGWIRMVESLNREEFNDCLRAFKNWKEEILNSFEYRYTNGYVEGINTKIKTLKRITFCMPNFDCFKKRIMYLTA